MSDKVNPKSDGSPVDPTTPPSITRSASTTSDLQRLLEEESPTIPDAIEQLKNASLKPVETTPLMFSEVVEGNGGQQFRLEYTTEVEREQLLKNLAAEALKKETDKGKKRKVRFSEIIIKMEVIEFNGHRYRLEYVDDEQRSELMTELAKYPDMPMLCKACAGRNAYGYLRLDPSDGPGDGSTSAAGPMDACNALGSHFKRAKN